LLRTMSFSFTKDDVRQHLLSLGYKNLTDEQLQEFCKDLKKLIRFEEKQKRIEAHLEFRKRNREHQQQRQQRRGGQRPQSADSTYSSGSDIHNSVEDGANIAKSPRLQKRVKQHQERRQMVFDKKSGHLDITKESMITTATVSYEDENDDEPSSASIVQERRKATYHHGKAAADGNEGRRRHRSHEDSTATSLSEELVKVKINLSKDSIGGEPSHTKESRAKVRPDFDGGCFDLLNRPTGESMTQQILPPRPEIPTKPTTSCIKPAFKEPRAKPVNRDPVQLHDYYQKHWSKLRLPGDGSDKQLRWAVREWMMRDPE